MSSGSRHGAGHSQASRVGAASLWAAASGFLVLFIAARSLSPADNAEFLAFWAALFGVTGILGGVTAETTRSAGAVTAAGRVQGHPQGAGMMANALLTGTILAGAIALLGLPFADRLFRENGTQVVLLLAGTSVVFAAQAALAGTLQGSGRWGPFSILVSLEALLRLAAVLAAVLLGGALFGIETACLAALSAWLIVLLISRPAREAARMRADVPAGAFLRQTGHALVSAAASAALLVSFPLLVKVTTSAEDFARAAPLLLAVSLTRAPIMLPLQAFQGMVMASVMRAGSRALLKPVTAVFVLGIAGAGLAAVAGPWIMLLLGPEYVVPRWVLAALTLASALIAVLTLTGTALLAAGRHRAYAAGWMIASLTAFLCLLLPFPTEVRCVLALLTGPAAGVGVHYTSLRRPAGQTERIPGLAS
ncbi:hypothetical protein [Arthrobacter sp. zg-Y1110]|uniref:hypothetical protein n=1 Tax=Arthrobacter sp. zg-Y1110 TaxID=2886932 RepID=UPI001D14E8DB|nr:hypothetical protein [Arthrobacter sp. zg-Y1110]MCC3292893.1 hypothetical protein [Arthrobacter sp. zg-Y1110]UWX86832.1 hypothetical protein N2K99_18490 [Arthrobacter sp. zg-Y1110]